MHAAFLYPSNGSADCIQIKLSVLLGTAWATTALPCIFGNAWANRLCPGERCEILFRPVWNHAHFKQAATPTHTTSRLIPASRDTARPPWAMAPHRPGLPPVMPSTRCLGWRAARPTGWSNDPVEIARVVGLRLTRSHACERKTQNTWFVNTECRGDAYKKSELLLSDLSCRGGWTTFRKANRKNEVMFSPT